MILGILIHLLQAVPAADETPPVVVELRCDRIETAPDDVELHRFGGGPAEMVVRLHGIQRRTVDVAARLHQVAASLVAPLGEPFELAAGIEGGDSAWRDVSVRVPLPEVERTSTIDVSYLVRDGRDGEWRSAGHTRVRVHPRNVLTPLRALAEVHPLLVVDPDGALTTTLRRQDIPYEEVEPCRRPVSGRDLDPTARDAVAIWVRRDAEQAPYRIGSSSVAKQLFARADRVAVLHEDSKETRHVTVVVVGERTRLDAPWPSGGALADDPRAQERLVKWIQLVVSEQDLEIDA